MLSHEGLQPDQILAIARRKGYFFVSLRYRDDYLTTRCKKLVKRGLLRRDYRWQRYDEGRGSYYVPTISSDAGGDPATGAGSGALPGRSDAS